MAKKKSKGSLLSGILTTLFILCILAICALAIKKSMQGPDPDLSAEGTDTQTSQSLTSTGAVTDTGTTDSVTDSDTASVTDTDITTSTNPSSSTTTNREEHVSANKTDSFDLDSWYLLLANPDNPVPEGYTFEKATVHSAGRDWIVDARCAEDMKAMIAAAKADGVSLILCSAYRNIETQTKNFNNKVQEYLKKTNPETKKPYTEEEAIKITATIIAVPGTSEHHTGMAADIVTPSYQSLNAGFDQTEAYKWLEANCAEFGFVLRYRKDKTDITKIIYEPWHYRYVGKEAATIMMAEGLSLEEFLEKYGT